LNRTEIFMDPVIGTGDREKIVTAIFDCIRGMFNAASEQTREVERETGLSYNQVWALKAISCSSPVRVSDLAKKMYHHPATIVGILDRLEARQLITRTRSREDRRVVAVDLTPKARRIVASMPEVFHNSMLDVFEEVEVGELMTMLGNLKKLSSLIEVHISQGDISSRSAEKRNNISQK